MTPNRRRAQRPATHRQADDRFRRNPLHSVRLTTPQCVFCSSTARKLLWRGGNQLGKSFGMAVDLVHFARGTSPYRETPRGPVRIMVISESFAQMDPLLEKIWDLLPKDEIDPKVTYAPGAGIKGYKNPHIRFIAGPGNGSVIVFATYGQKSRGIAGGSFHAIYADEPMPESIYGELQPRLSRYHGIFRCSMTPTPETAKHLGWLRELVDKGGITECTTSFSFESIRIRGPVYDWAWKTPAEVEEEIGGWLDLERPMREHGDWDPVRAGRWLTAYLAEHFSDARPPPRTRLWVAVGMDHGAKAGRQAGVLVVYSPKLDQLWYLDETRSDGRTSSTDDAASIIDMLKRQGLTWSDVDYWIGDRAHGGDYWGNAKSNRELELAFSKVLRVPRRELNHHGLRLRTPRKNKGSVVRGIRLMNSMFKDGQALVSDKCEQLDKAIKGWEGALQDPLKDIIDAARYATEVLVDENVLALRVPSASPLG